MYNFIEDDEETIEVSKSLAEYQAWFIEPKLVDEVRKNRRLDESNISKEEDEVFKASIGKMFGKSIGEYNNEYGDRLQRTISRIADYEARQQIQKTPTPFNYQYWADVEVE